LGRRSYGVFGIIAAVFVLLTFWRNEDYRSARAIWADTLAKAPKSWRAYCNFGNLLIEEGDVDGAMEYYQRALSINPDVVPVCNNLANALVRKGRAKESVLYCEKAIRLDPKYPLAYANLGNALLQLGRMDEAITNFEMAIKLQPQDYKSESDLGSALMKVGRWKEAIAHYRAAAQLAPRDASVCNNLAWVLAACPVASLRNGPEAVELGIQADQLLGGTNSMIIGTLAAAYAEAGRFTEALMAARHALALTTNAAQIEVLKTNIQLYEAGRPYHLPEVTDSP